jgi:phospholipid transport system transporter-binding protein
MISCEGGRCTVRGPITLANVTELLRESERLLGAAELTVDLSEVTEADSSAVSLLLEWRRRARSAGRRIRYVNVPPGIQSLAKLYGVAELLDEER